MNNNSHRKDYFIVLLLWLFFQFAWYLYLGVFFGLESIKYIDEASYFLEEHRFSQFRYLFYCTTIFVIATAKVLNIGLYGALAIIMLINLASYLELFKALKRFFSHRFPAFLVVTLMLSFWPFQSWSLFLYTECLFYSMVIFFLSHLLLFRGLTPAFILKGCVLVLLLMISRPLGILFGLPFLAFIFFKLNKKQRLYFIMAGVLFLALLNFVVQIVFTTTSDWNMTRALTEDSIICDMPRADARGQLDLTQHPNQFYQLLYYVTHNFEHFAGLALIRLRYFFLLVRDYYSSFHNLYLIAYLVLFYGSIVLGIKRLKESFSRSLGWFLLLTVLLFAAAIALQCDDYHNRFFLTLTPFFALTTVTAWWPLLQKFPFFGGRRTH
jgi:hypothetical protein